MYSAPYSGQILMKVQFSRQVCKKSSNLKFHEMAAELFRADRRTDENAKARSSFYQICQQA